MGRTKTKKKTPVTMPRSVHRLFPQVTSVTDATVPVEVSVAARDCKQGQQTNPSECALARAARRELKVDGVIIGLSSSYLIRGTTALRFDTPESVKREIVSFDRHGDFAPGEYYLTPKSPSCRLGEARYKPTSQNKTVRRKVHLSARVRMLPKGAGE